jgi:tRNA-Thr(GGU) m(6)t(6)A37 methyltransferase TsaA
MELKQIGIIKIKNNEYKAKVNEKYIQALEGLDGFSHCIILWWANKCDNPEAREILDCKKPYKKSPEKLGIFSTRSPARPNPIATSVVRILSIDKNGTIILPYIDADDNTPIIDIKPYQPNIDKVNNLMLPEWCNHWPESLEESANFDWEQEFNF